MVPEPQNAEAFPLEKLRAFRIARDLRVLVVVAAIEFNHKADGEAGEIRDIGADRRLSAEMRALQRDAVQFAPKPAFGGGSWTRAGGARVPCGSA